MNIISRSKHLMFDSVMLLLLPFLGVTSGLQQIQTSTFLVRRSVSFQKRSASVTNNNVDDATSDLSEDEPHLIAYDWDEQFDELQSFMSEFGHCNFPQSPSKPLQNKYPMLENFCRDLRMEYRQLQSTKKINKRMTLRVFDRDVRCRRLEELGFEFLPNSAEWYDHFHELMEYSSENGHSRVTERENKVLRTWIYKQRRRRKQSILPDSKIKLLEDIGFEWKSEVFDERWHANYNKLVEFRNKHGNFIMGHSDPLYKWMAEQRRKRARPERYYALTDEQIKLLDEIEFPWKSERYDSMWYAMYHDLQRFQKKHGHCRPSNLAHMKLCKWCNHQRVKHRKSRLSTEQIKQLDQLGFSWEFDGPNFPKMFLELTEYFSTHGHLQVNQDDNKDLYEWMITQRQRYHGKVRPVMTDQQIEKLEEMHFCWSLDWRERTWHEKYAEAVEFLKQNGHLLVAEKENPSLYSWIQTQGKRYEEVKGQKPLSEEELELLEQLDFPFFDGQPRMAWTAMYAKVSRYREENDGLFPSHKDHPGFSRWLRQQRHRYRNAYGYAPLPDEQKSLLESIDFPRYPEGKQLRKWYEMYDELVEFWKQNGHFFVNKSTENALHLWLTRQRMCFHGTGVMCKPLSKLQVYLLERIGFTWTSDRNEVRWQNQYDGLAEFVKIQGHFPTPSDDPKLSRWMSHQRRRRKFATGSTHGLSKNQIHQLDKIGFSW